MAKSKLMKRGKPGLIDILLDMKELIRKKLLCRLWTIIQNHIHGFGGWGRYRLKAVILLQKQLLVWEHVMPMYISFGSNSHVQTAEKSETDTMFYYLGPIFFQHCYVNAGYLYFLPLIPHY